MTEERVAYAATLPSDHDLTIADLMQRVSYTRHVEAAAKRERERADYELIAYLEGIGEKSATSDELHIRATVVTRRTAKVANEQRLAEALNEIGLVIPRKEAVDTTELLAIADRFGGDFPGVEVTTTEYVTVKGLTR